MGCNFADNGPPSSLPTVVRSDIDQQANRVLQQAGYGTCGRCNTAWPLVKSHDTQCEEGWGMFPLCEDCWAALSPEERWPYYEALVEKWRLDSPDFPKSNFPNMKKLKEIVLSGL